MTFQNKNPKSPSRYPSITGLPSDGALRELAKTYLDEQHRHFPEYQKLGLLPESDDASYEDMANRFATTYRSGNHQSFPQTSRLPKEVKLGAAYVRYSDSNSNTRSLDQQLINVLTTAKRHNVFIPWTCVFADAAITATTTERPGYQLLRSLVSSPEKDPEIVIVDELDRLHRDQEESIRFGKIVQGRQRQLVTFDGFDSTNASSKLTQTVSALQSEMYIDQLKVKVNRGMTDAFRNGKPVGMPPAGYKLEPNRTLDGKLIFNRKGKLVRDIEIDEAESELVQRIFKLYAYEKLSPARIARLLDKEKALGRTTWSASSVSQMLKNEKYIGRWVWKKTSRVLDPITGKSRAATNPTEQQLVKEFPDLRIISEELWDAARQREKNTSRSTRPNGGSIDNRRVAYPNMLFDLRCVHCDRPLQRYRSVQGNTSSCIAPTERTAYAAAT